jgi:hypothetical protein
MDSHCSFSIVKFSVGFNLLNSSCASYIFVLFWSYIISTSSTYL